MVSVAVAVPPALIALIVTLFTPAAVGVPERSPVLVSIVTPVGKPVAVAALLITGVAGLTVSVKVAEPVPLALMALIVTLLTPVAVGVPESRPVLVLTLTPVGKFVAAKLVGVFVAVI